VRTHYELLGVTRAATADEIKRAYYNRARLYHPDAHSASAPAVRDEAERAMQALNQAWNALRDPLRRRRYDRSLERTAAREPHGVQRRATSRRAAAAAADRPTQLALTSGFQLWLGASTAIRTHDGRPAYNLRVAGAKDLAPLAPLAPDRLIGLHAARAAITDDDLRHLRDMTGLRVLDLTGTPVTDLGILHLLGCTALETVWLWDTAITDASLDLIARLPKVCQLGLGNTQVTDRGLEPLARLHNLRLLQLWGTQVTGPGLRHLYRLPELEVVTLPWSVRGRDRRRLGKALAASRSQNLAGARP
jgi:hypothetical protein